MLSRYLLPAAAALLGLATAQVHTDCNPMEKDDCPNNPAFGMEYDWNFNSTPKGQLWEQVVGPITYDDEDGATFTIKKQGDSPTIRTKFYIFFGRIEFSLKAAAGQGIVSSMMLLSDNLDEIDWEFIGTNTSHGSTNFFGKGIEDYTNGEWHAMPVGPQDDYHNYTTLWTKEKMDFWIDEQHVRTIVASETENNGTDTYPQTPMRMSLGIWAGGDPSLNEWTREWAGGNTDYGAGPFHMHVKSARIEDFGTGKEYAWGDRTGDWESIEMIEGNSTAYEAVHKKPEVEKSINEKFNDLPQAAKIAIYAGGATVAAVLLAGLIFYCIKQRRRGISEAKLAEERARSDRLELEGLKKAGINPDAFTEHGHEYNPREVTKGGATYTAVNDGADDFQEKAWGGAAAVGAGAGAGAVGVAALTRTNTHGTNSSYHDVPMSPRTPQNGSFPPAALGPAVHRTDSPGRVGSPMSRMGSPQSRMGSPGPQQAYGAHRMQHGPGDRSFSDSNYPSAYGAGRMNSGPSPMSPPSRSFSSGPNGYRQ